jgi:methionine-rich copper-binding protein CopC
VGSNPSDNGFMMAVSNNITLNFSEAIVKGTGLLELYKADGSLVQSFDAATSTALTWSGSTLTINPTADLLANTSYYIKIAPTAVKDTTGNAYAGIADVTTLNFTTANGDGSIPLTPTYPGESNSRLGISVSNLGDVNGDGFDDVIVGASGGNGAAYVIYGNASGAGVSLTSGTIAADKGFKIVGPSASSYTGDSVSSMGDINGDGLADILVGAYHGAGTTADGAAYVVFGSTQGTTVNLSAFNASQGFKIVGPERLGFSVSNAGDVNGDGINDMIAGALPGTGTGTAYVIYGKTSGMNFNFVGNSTLDPSDGFRLMGTTASGGANLGFTVSSAGDFNGDGYADVIVGADGQWDAYIIFGGPTGFGGGDVISLAAAGKGIKLNGDVLRMGHQVAGIGDHNGDGLSDIVMVANTGSTAYHVNVIYGTSDASVRNISMSDLPTNPSLGYRITSNYVASSLTRVSGAGDMNGDGIADLVISGYAAITYSGWSYVVYGTSNVANNLDNLGRLDLSGQSIDPSLGFRVYNNAMGESISTAGDFNGDGLDDLIFGSIAGRYSILLGGTQWVTQAVQGAGVITGMAEDEALIGSAVDDILTGGGGVDRFFAVAGNDTIVLTASDVANLASNSAASVKAMVDGGTGYDTIRLAGGANLDLTQITNVGAMGTEERSRIESIERIDLATDTAANKLTISSRDIKDMAGFNRIHTGLASEDGQIWTNVSGAALSTTTRYHQMVVEATAADSVVLTADLGGWLNVGTVSNGTSTYNVFQNDKSNTQIIVGQGAAMDLPPNLVGSTPSDNGFMTALGNDLVLNFSETVVKGTGLIELFNANGTLVQSFDVVSSGLVTGWGTANLTINPTNNLLASTGYYIKIASTAVKDTTGNAYAGISDATTLNFRTTDEDGGIPPTAMSGSGYVVSSAGDVNGDGFDDVMVGVPTLRNEPYTGSYLAGGAYVIYGNAAGTLPALPMNTATGVNASIAASVGFKISSAMSAESRFGAAVSGIGDVNGDGFDDVMMGLGGTNARAFVVYGGATNAGVSIDTAGNINNSQGFKIALASGFDSTAAFGSVVTGLGDVNGDGVADFGVRVISSLANSFSYVLYGSKTNQSDLVVTGEMNQYAIGDASRGYRLAGLVTAVGDMNNDGMADVVATTYNNNDNSSAATIYYSNANGTANTTNAAYSVTGTISNSPMRQVTSMGDVNGDGIADLAVLSSNHVFVVYGQTGTTNVALSTLSATQGYKIVLPTGSSHYDWISSAGDVNGDGLADVIIGKQNTYANFAMVVYGNATGTDVQLSHILGYSSGYNVSDDALPASQGFKISSVPGGEIGYRVSNAGDFNGDGLADLIVGGLAAQDGVFGIVLGGTQFVTNAVQGSGTVNGTSGSEALFGSTANDTLTGGGGVDRFFAGEGNDTIVLTATDVTNLANVTTGQTVKTSTDGGGGFDTLRLTGGANLNLTTINNVGGMGLEEHSRIESIERIDMATDTASNTLSLQARDVRDMAGMNLIRIGSVSADGKTWSNVTGTALSATTKFHQLVVEGGSNDNLTLGTDLGFWSVTGTVNNGTHNYTVYQNAGSNAQVLVRAGVVVTNNDSVAPVVLDLNRDGDLSYSQTLMDVNGDGQLDQTAWAGAQDGVLVWDKYADGVVHDNSQYAFSQYGAAGSTDLQGLAAGFDTNHDGEFNAQDAKFAEFKVWQDGNGNGASDVGEVRSLAELGIEAIQLTSDGVVRAPAVGVQEAGRSTAQLADGGQMLVADAAFAFQTVPQLDFAGFVAQAQAESKAQPLPAQASVKLFLYDMIQGATAAEQGIGALFAAEGEGLSAPEPQHLGFHMDLLAEHLLQPPQS